MDLDSEGEKYEVEPFDAAVVTSRRNIRNPVSRGFHCCLILPLLFVLALSVTSLSYFAVTDQNVGDADIQHGTGRCILFARYNGDVKDIDLSSGHACVFSIFGEVAVAVLASFLIVWMIVKTSAGFHMTTWMLLCEIPVLVLLMTFAFCVSITISIGIALTCSAYKKVPSAAGGCSNYTLPGPGADRSSHDTVFFYDNVNTSMVTSWVVVVLLFFLVGLHILLFVVFCVKRAKHRSSHELLPTSDGESSSDGDSTDEAMVPIAELEKR